MKESFVIPDSFRIYPYYDHQYTFDVDEKTELHFYDDIVFLKSKKGGRPWLSFQEHAPRLMAEWKEKQPFLENCYTKRDRKAAYDTMVNQSAKLLQTVFWLNERPVSSLTSLKDSVNSLDYLPVNFYERYSFIIQQPDHFHAYNQLKALFEEIEKLFVKVTIIKKKAMVKRRSFSFATAVIT